MEALGPEPVTDMNQTYSQPTAHLLNEREDVHLLLEGTAW